MGCKPMPRMASPSVWRVAQHAPHGITRPHASATSSIDEAPTAYDTAEGEASTSLPVGGGEEGEPQGVPRRVGVSRGHQARQRSWKGPQVQQQRQGGTGLQEQDQERVTTGPKSPAIINISHAQNIGSAAAFIKRTIMGEGAAMVACNGDAALWQAFRALRCARSMLIEDEGTTPVFQPVLMSTSRNGLSAGTMALYTHKIVNGQFNVSSVMRISSSSRVEFIASAIVARIKERGSVVLESFGKVPAVVSIKAIELARRRMVRERLDVAVAVDPIVVEVDSADIGATLMNRFVLLECGVRDPTNLRVKVEMRLAAPRP
ncbi:hypothetical protein FOA52_004985 [Chlamydomonas sp. UWO 241]|nr:hypothetical protein FOA52_004985 [Chlamydomonas sp. UWO 241]